MAVKRMATSSLPVPDSPLISTLIEETATADQYAEHILHGGRFAYHVCCRAVNLDILCMLLLLIV